MANEFRVNSYGANWQESPDVTRLADGGFVIVWDSYFSDLESDYSGYYVAAQRYDAAGRPVGGEQVVDAIDGAAARDARVTTLSDGGYAVTWAYGAEGVLDQTDVYVRAYNANGTARTSAVRVDTIPLFEAVAPDVVATSGGGFKVFFGADRSNLNWLEVFSRQFDRNGNPLRAETLVNVNEREFDQDYVRTAELRGGGSVAVWTSQWSFEAGAEADRNELRATIYQDNGTVRRADFLLNDNIGSVSSFVYRERGGGYDVGALNDGGFIVSQRYYGFRIDSELQTHILLQTFDARGRPTSERFSAHGTDELMANSRVVQLASGQIVVVWEESSSNFSDFSYDIRGRMFDAAGRPLTGVFNVAQDRRYAQEDPELEALAGGGFVVTYMSEAADEEDEGIAARVFGRGTASDDFARVDVTGVFSGLGGNDRIYGNAARNQLFGGTGADTLVGGARGDRLQGDGGRDALYGGVGADVLSGGLGSDLLRGGAGADRLQGGSWADVFVFGSVSESGPRAQTRDTIVDFSGRDQIDLAAIDAWTSRRGDQAFRFIGDDAFSGQARQLRYDDESGVLAGDVNGDGRADFSIRLAGAPTLSADDFIL